MRCKALLQKIYGQLNQPAARAPKKVVGWSTGFDIFV